MHLGLPHFSFIFHNPMPIIAPVWLSSDDSEEHVSVSGSTVVVKWQE